MSKLKNPSQFFTASVTIIFLIFFFYKDESATPLLSDKIQPSLPVTNRMMIQSASSVPNGKSKNKSLSFIKEAIYDREGTSAFLQKGGTVSNLDRRKVLLCKLQDSRQCETRYISEVIDLLYAFAPLYAMDQKNQMDLYLLHDNFLNYLKSIGINSFVLEAILPSKGQKYMRTTAGNDPYEIQLTVEDTFYYRENFLNVMARKTMGIWEYMMWVDAHQLFDNTYWWEEAIYKMEQTNVVQFFQHVSYLWETNATEFGYHAAGYKYKLYNFMFEGTNYFAGNAWGLRKDVYLKLGYILDTCIAGACDFSLTYALFKSTADWPAGYAGAPDYFEKLKPWIQEAHDVLQENWGIVRGELRHWKHSHNFDYFGIQRKVAPYIVQRDLQRDENFTLSLRNKEMRVIFPF